ncbi:4739_t:CDS:1, partial [Acaulospora colombiana]
QFPTTSRDITSTPPTPPGAKDGLKPNGDTLFVSRSGAILSPSPRSPPTTSSLLVPTPRPLSEIPSARSSMMGEDNDSEYETADDMEGDSDGTHTPHPPSPPHDISTLPEIRNSHSDGSTLDASPRISPNLPDQQNANDPQGNESVSHESQNPEASTSNSTASTSTQGRRKSVRMLIYPTVAVSPPERYDDETVTPSRSDQSPPLTPASSSTIRAAPSATAGPSTWETRINASHNVWDDSSEEDEEYRRAKRALSRATEPL